MPEASDTRTRVLLVNPPVYDTRLPWARWQYPSLLPRISSRFRSVGCDVKFVDALRGSDQARFRRKLATRFDLDGIIVSQWRHGRTTADVVRNLRALKRAGWQPDRVFIECFTAIWWRGASEVSSLVRQVFPDARVGIVGGYPASAPRHVERWCSATPCGSVPIRVRSAPNDWSMMSPVAGLGYLTFAGGARSPGDLVDEVEAGAASGVRDYALAEHAVVSRYPDLVLELFERVLSRGVRARFILPGTVSPFELLRHPELALLLRRAGCTQIFFSDDRQAPQSREADEKLVDAYRRVAELCHRAGFPRRSDALSGGVCLGRAGEALGARAALLTRVAGAIGAVLAWPYQPTPAECAVHGGSRRYELCNGKIFPLRKANGATYRDYLNLLGLAAVLNAKYRDHTFHFDGPGFISGLLRDSLAREAWIPDPAVKGGLRLPVLPPRVGEEHAA